MVKKVTGKRVVTTESATKTWRPGSTRCQFRENQGRIGMEPPYPDLERIIETAWEWHRNHPNGYEADPELSSVKTQTSNDSESKILKEKKFSFKSPNLKFGTDFIFEI